MRNIKTGARPHQRPEKPWRSFSLIRPLFLRYRYWLICGFAALLAVDALQLIIPRVIKQAVDALERGEATGHFLLVSGGIIVLLALGISVCRFIWRYLILGFSRLLEGDLRSRMLAHLLLLDRPFFQHHPAGELMALATNDLAAVQLACGMGLVACVDAVVISLAALGFMAYIHPGLTLIAVAPMPVLALLTRLLSARLHRRFRKVQEEFSRLTEFARNALSSIRLIKAYTQEEDQIERFDARGRIYVLDNLKLAMVQGTLFPIAGLVANLSLLLVLFFGGRLTVRGVITAGDFVAFITYLFMMTWPMMAIGWVTNLFQRGATSLARIQGLLETRPVLHDPQAAEEAQTEPYRGRISLRGLTFRYGQARRPALRNVSLDLGPGLLGIVGRTGSGKTTLCHLLTRLYPVEESTLFLDDMDVNRLPLDQVRGTIAYVPQDVVLFSDTIRANIALGSPEADQRDIEAVARIAAIHEEILSMPQGYETRIGERGVTLSGGQRQRIALARALLLDRPILIIDDGLSAVDTDTEYAIIQSLAHHIKGKTCIIVSHRVAPLAGADSIVVMDDGAIVARGSHAELMMQSDFYRTIYEHQQSGCEEGSVRREE